MRNNLIQARKSKNLTQIQVAKKLGISVRQYQALEAGTSDGSIKVWYKLKKLLNAKTIDFLLEQEIGIQPDINLEKHLYKQDSITKVSTQEKN